MSERILISPDELNEGAAYIRQRLDTLVAEIAAIKSKVDDITARWEGAAQQSFLSTFDTEMYPVLKEKMPPIVEGMASELDLAANSMRDLDDNLATSFSGS